MHEPKPDPDAYLDAFMNGFEFVLLAMRGRLAEERLPAAERARLEAFLADYARIARAYRDRQPAKPLAEERFPTAMPFKAEMPLPTN